MAYVDACNAGEFDAYVEQADPTHTACHRRIHWAVTCCEPSTQWFSLVDRDGRIHRPAWRQCALVQCKRRHQKRRARYVRVQREKALCGLGCSGAGVRRARERDVRRERQIVGRQIQRRKGGIDRSVEDASVSGAFKPAHSTRGGMRELWGNRPTPAMASSSGALFTTASAACISSALSVSPMNRSVTCICAGLTQRAPSNLPGSAASVVFTGSGISMAINRRIFCQSLLRDFSRSLWFAHSVCASIC